MPDRFNEDQRIAVANEIINRIKERTEAGLDSKNRAFKPYAKSYIEDQDFKLAGKSKTKVDLTFTGEMLNSIEILNQGIGFVVIGFEEGETNEKASFAKDKGRDFLGITEKEKNSIIQSIADSTEPEIEEIIEVPTLTQRILDRIRGN